jgi:hypothetical protein
MTTPARPWRRHPSRARDAARATRRRARDEGEDKRSMNKYFHDRFVTIRDASED